WDHMVALLLEGGLRYHRKDVSSARRPSAGAMPGRCGFCLAADTHRPLVPLGLVLLRFRRQQLLRLGAEAAEFLILRPVFLHPLDGLLEAPAGVALVAEPPVGHGQEKPVPTVAALVLHRLLQGGLSALPVAGSVVSHPQRVPVLTVL